MDIVDPRHEELILSLFVRTCTLLEMRGFELKPLRRRARGTGKFRSFAYGYTRLTEKSVTIDFYTPRTMKHRKMDAILRVICHELAHHQSPPRLAFFRGRFVRLAHHPHFWNRYKKNVAILMQDEILSQYFSL